MSHSVNRFTFSYRSLLFFAFSRRLMGGALSIMANGEWIDPLTAHNQGQGRLKSHIRINEKYLNNMPIKAKLADKSKPILSIGKNFNLEPSGIEKIDVPLGTEQVE